MYGQDADGRGGAGSGEVRVRMDRYTRVCLTVIAALLTVLIVGLWADRAPTTGEARAAAGFLDSGATQQLTRLLKAQEQTNARLKELIALLGSGRAKVQVVESEAKPPAPAGGNHAQPKKR